MEKLTIKTQSFDKQRVWPMVLIGTLFVLLLSIYLYSFICVQNLQIQLEEQGKVIETLKTRINLICAEKLVESDNLRALTTVGEELLEETHFDKSAYLVHQSGNVQYYIYQCRNKLRMRGLY